MLNFLGAVAKIYEKIHDSIDEWNTPAPVANRISNLAAEVVDALSEVDGMTQAHGRDFNRATPRFTLRDGSVLKIWKDPMGCNYVFIADCDGNMVFGGFVEWWVHTNDLNDAVAAIRQKFT